MRDRSTRVRRLLAFVLLLAVAPLAAAFEAARCRPELIIDRMPLDTRRPAVAELGVRITEQRTDGTTWIYRWETDYTAAKDGFVVFDSRDELCLLATAYGMSDSHEFDRLVEAFEERFGKPDGRSTVRPDGNPYDQRVWGQNDDEDLSALTERLGTILLLPDLEFEALRTTIDELLARKLPHARVPFAFLGLMPAPGMEFRRPLDAAVVAYLPRSCR